MPRGTGGVNQITFQITGDAQNAIRTVQGMSRHIHRLARSFGSVGTQSAHGYNQAGQAFSRYASRTVRESSRVRRVLVGLLGISERFGRQFARAGLRAGFIGLSVVSLRTLTEQAGKFNRQLDRGAGFANEMRNNIAALGGAMRAFGEGTAGAGEAVADFFDLLFKGGTGSKEAQRAIRSLNLEVDKLRALPPIKAFDILLGQLSEIRDTTRRVAIFRQIFNENQPSINPAVIANVEEFREYLQRSRDIVVHVGRAGRLFRELRFQFRAVFNSVFAGISRALTGLQLPRFDEAISGIGFRVQLVLRALIDHIGPAITYLSQFGEVFKSILVLIGGLSVAKIALSSIRLLGRFIRLLSDPIGAIPSALRFVIRAYRVIGRLPYRFKEFRGNWRGQVRQLFTLLDRVLFRIPSRIIGVVQPLFTRVFSAITSRLSSSLKSLATPLTSFIDTFKFIRQRAPGISRLGAVFRAFNVTRIVHGPAAQLRNLRSALVKFGGTTLGLNKIFASTGRQSISFANRLELLRRGIRLSSKERLRRNFGLLDLQAEIGGIISRAQRRLGAPSRLEEASRRAAIGFLRVTENLVSRLSSARKSIVSTVTATTRLVRSYARLSTATTGLRAAGRAAVISITALNVGLRTIAARAHLVFVRPFADAYRFANLTSNTLRAAFPLVHALRGSSVYFTAFARALFGFTNISRGVIRPLFDLPALLARLGNAARNAGQLVVVAARSFATHARSLGAAAVQRTAAAASRNAIFLIPAAILAAIVLALRYIWDNTGESITQWLQTRGLEILRNTLGSEGAFGAYVDIINKTFLGLPKLQAQAKIDQQVDDYTQSIKSATGETQRLIDEIVPALTEATKAITPAQLIGRVPIPKDFHTPATNRLVEEGRRIINDANRLIEQLPAAGVAAADGQVVWAQGLEQIIQTSLNTISAVNARLANYGRQFSPEALELKRTVNDIRDIISQLEDDVFRTARTRIRLPDSGDFIAIRDLPKALENLLKFDELIPRRQELANRLRTQVGKTLDAQTKVKDTLEDLVKNIFEAAETLSDDIVSFTVRRPRTTIGRARFNAFFGHVSTIPSHVSFSPAETVQIQRLVDYVNEVRRSSLSLQDQITLLEPIWKRLAKIITRSPVDRLRDAAVKFGFTLEGGFEELRRLFNRAGELASEQASFAKLGEDLAKNLSEAIHTSIATANFKEIGNAVLEALKISFAKAAADALKPFVDSIVGVITGLFTKLLKGLTDGLASGIGNILGPILGGLFGGGAPGFLPGVHPGSRSPLGLHFGYRVPRDSGPRRAVLLGGESVLSRSSTDAIDSLVNTLRQRPGSGIDGIGGGDIIINSTQVGDVNEATRRAMFANLDEFGTALMGRLASRGYA